LFDEQFSRNRRIVCTSLWSMWVFPLTLAPLNFLLIVEYDFWRKSPSSIFLSWSFFLPSSSSVFELCFSVALLGRHNLSLLFFFLKVREFHNSLDSLVHLLFRKLVCCSSLPSILRMMFDLIFWFGGDRAIWH
jgi:hypothetical protein